MNRIAAIVPAYNEEKAITAVVNDILEIAQSQNLSITVIVVNDCSLDSTSEIISKLKCVALNLPVNLGIGGAVQTGFKYAFENGFDYAIQIDGDGQHPASEIPKLINAAKENKLDVVIGSRYVKGGSLDKNWPLWRKFLSGFGNNYARTILRFPLHDVTTGFRMWKREALSKMPLDRIRSSGYIFLVEMAYVAYLMGYDIVEVPIHFEDRRFGKSKMSLKIQLEAAIRIWDVRWHYSDMRSKSRPHEIKIEE